MRWMKLLPLTVALVAATGAHAASVEAGAADPMKELTRQLGGTEYIHADDTRYRYTAICILPHKRAKEPYVTVKKWGRIKDMWMARGHWLGDLSEISDKEFDPTHAFVIYAAPRAGGPAANPKAPLTHGNPASYMRRLGATQYLVAHSTATNSHQFRTFCLTEQDGARPLPVTEWGNFDQAFAVHAAGPRDRHYGHALLTISRPTP